MVPPRRDRKRPTPPPLVRVWPGAPRQPAEPGSAHTGHVSDVSAPTTAIERALADVARGDRLKARLRLKCYLVNEPASITARRLLAELYRADGYLDEAGRWGYLLEDGATAEERAAYERACAYRLHPRWTSTYIRKGLRWNAPVEAADDYAAAILRELDARSAAEEEDYHRALDAIIWNRIGPALRRVRSWLSTRSAGGPRRH